MEISMFRRKHEIPIDADVAYPMDKALQLLEEAAHCVGRGEREEAIRLLKECKGLFQMMLAGYDT